MAGGHEKDAATVLLVEDYDDTRQMMRMLLEAKGCRVVEAADGRAAVESATLSSSEMNTFFVPLPRQENDAKNQYVFKESNTNDLNEEYSEERIRLFHDRPSSKQVVQICSLRERSVLTEEEVEKNLPDEIVKFDKCWNSGMRRALPTS